MAKRMKHEGKRYAVNSETSIKRKIMAIVLITVLLTVLVIESALSFFSDIVISATNTVLGTVNIETTNVQVEQQDTIPEEHPITFIPGTPGVQYWTLGDVNNFRWTVTNTGRSRVRLTNTLRIAWDLDILEYLSTLNVVHVYSASMTDSDIRYDIANNNAGNALNSSILTETDFEFQNDDERRGIELVLENLTGINHIYLDGTMESVGTTPISTHTFEFKIAFGLREDSGEPMTYINQFIGEHLHVEIETRANLTSGSTAWANTQYGNVRLRVDPDHEVFTGLIPGDVWDYYFTGGMQQATIGPGTYFLQVWGAQGGNDTPVTDRPGGTGGYSEGFVTFATETTVFIAVGGQGGPASATGGWNGGGAVTSGNGRTGGGASHMSLTTGLLSNPAVRTDALLAAGRWRWS